MALVPMSFMVAHINVKMLQTTGFRNLEPENAAYLCLCGLSGPKLILPVTVVADLWLVRSFGSVFVHLDLRSTQNKRIVDEDQITPRLKGY